jgi:hypothetical protein
MFPMDLDQELDPADAADDERLTVPNRFSIDLEISSVFKPRPMRPRIHNDPHYAHLAGGKNKRAKKHKHLSMLSSTTNTDGPNIPQAYAPEHSSSNSKSHNRRQGRDKRREEKRKALEAHASQAVETAGDLSRQDTLIPASSTTVTTTTFDTGVLIVGLESLHVGLVEDHSSITELVVAGTEFDDDNDVFATPLTTIPSFPTFSASDTAESHLDVAVIDIVDAMGAMSGEKEEQSRLIVEALVVRKMSMEEAFLDFGGFSLT